MQALSDAEAMRSVKSGDGEAFAVVVDRYKNPLMNYLTHLCGNRDQAEEYAQEAFMRLYQTVIRYDEREKLAPYLFRIATNLVRTDFRRARRWRLLLPWLNLPDRGHEDSPHKRLFDSEIQRNVRAAIASLSLRYRAPLVLREIEGWSYLEIAAAIGCREGTVKSRIARARDQLRTRLAPYWTGGTTHESRRTQGTASLPAARRSL